MDNFRSGAEEGDADDLGGAWNPEPTKNIVRLAEDFTEEIEAMHPGMMIGEIAIVIELIDPQDRQSTIITRAETTRRWVAIGLFRAALRALERIT